MYKVEKRETAKTCRLHQVITFKFCNRLVVFLTSNGKSLIVEERILLFVFVLSIVEERKLRFVFAPSIVGEQILRFVFVPSIVEEQILRLVFVPLIV
jgi:hypothetical protein